MTPLMTVNLLRALFVTFCAAIGGMITVETQESALSGILLGGVFGLLLVLADRLLKGFSLRAFSSATFGLLLGLLFANLLMASQILRFQSETAQWATRLVAYTAFAYVGMMLAIRSSRDEFSLIIPYVRFARETTQREPLVVDEVLSVGDAAFRRRALEALRNGVPNADAVRVLGCSQAAVEAAFNGLLDRSDEGKDDASQAPGLLVAGCYNDRTDLISA
jgi:hypothetical protein